jgi:hypothetical protein
VLDVAYARDEIAKAMRQQIDHGRFPRDDVYGDGAAGKRIADLLAEVPLRIEKRLTY